MLSIGYIKNRRGVCFVYVCSFIEEILRNLDIRK